MPQTVKLVGLDCGSTTTSLVVARARLTGAALGRVEVSDVTPVFMSELVLTPFADHQIDAAPLARLIDDWLKASQTEPAEIFGGGALITGLAAERSNARAIATAIEARMGDTLIATAQDPALESWLAFLGNCYNLSLAHAERPLLNLDIGGGTTNLAWGRNGQVHDTACLFVGARHFQFVPGTYQMRAMSEQGRALLRHLGIAAAIGQTLAEGEIAAIARFQARTLLHAVQGDTPADAGEAAVWQVPWQHPEWVPRDASLTLSGGVGQWAYDLLAGRSAWQVTPYGDLGGELARAIVELPDLRTRLAEFEGETRGRATVLGLMRHASEIAGSTLYLPKAASLPLKHVPIVGQLDMRCDAGSLSRMLALAAHAMPAGCLRVELPTHDLSGVRSLADRLSQALTAASWPPDRTLLLLLEPNLGKVLGNYVTRWGALPIDLIVVDEIPPRDAQFVSLGRPREGVVPLWLYGLPECRARQS